jgi:hypothetical protein
LEFDEQATVALQVQHEVLGDIAELVCALFDTKQEVNGLQIRPLPLENSIQANGFEGLILRCENKAVVVVISLLALINISTETGSKF